MNVPKLMTNEQGPSSVATRADVADRAQIGGDLQASLTRYMDSSTGSWRTLLADLEQRYEGAVWRDSEDNHERVLGLLEYTRLAVRSLEQMATAGPPKQDHLTPADFEWHHVLEVWHDDDVAGRALWERIQQVACDELREGRAGAVAIEGYDERPMARAEYLAVWLALADGLKPSNGAERLLVDGMAQALIMQRHWLTRMVETESLDSLRRRGSQDGYKLPRLSEVEAVDRAAAMQDRFHRQFLRLMKCYRDGRRLIASMTVLGGQINVSEQQIISNSFRPRTSDLGEVNRSPAK